MLFRYKISCKQFLLLHNIFYFLFSQELHTLKELAYGLATTHTNLFSQTFPLFFLLVTNVVRAGEPILLYSYNYLLYRLAIHLNLLFYLLTCKQRSSFLCFEKPDRSGFPLNTCITHNNGHIHWWKCSICNIKNSRDIRVYIRDLLMSQYDIVNTIETVFEECKLW